MNNGPLTIGGTTIPLGNTEDVRLEISETYTGDKIYIPMRVIRAKTPGPTVFISAAIHGDEINGTGIIHDFLFGSAVDLIKGTLILIPVINVFGFESHDRYLPDRRDLNRSFPGTANGSLASRIAHKLMSEIVAKCDFGIDLHTAAYHRTNYPNVRADLTNPDIRRLAAAFGCALIVDGKGPVGSLRREASKQKCPTIILEAGEPFKIEPGILAIGYQGIQNVLISFDMLNGKMVRPPYQVNIRKTKWLRATVGGILKFHVSPGDFIEENQPIATNYSILGKEQNVILSTSSGIILGMTTMPAVKPGEPICHIASISSAMLKRCRKNLLGATSDPHSTIQQDLATNLTVVDAHR